MASLASPAFASLSPIARRSLASTIGDRIDALMSKLDALTGDPDMEDDDPDHCLAGDDGCGPIKREDGRVTWGGYYLDLAGPPPAYAINQAVVSSGAVQP